jgi:hypothetical protein
MIRFYPSVAFALFILSASVSTAQNVGIGISTPLQKLHIGGNSNTIRVDGLSSSGTMFGAPAASERLVFVTGNGDLKALSNGTSGQVLTISGSGMPAWSASTSSGWSLTGNSGTVAGTNFIGTTDAIDWLVKTNNTERLRIGATGNVGINVTPSGTERVYITDATQTTALKVTTTNNTAGSKAIHANGVAGTDSYLGYMGSITLGTLAVTNAGIYSSVTSGTSAAIVGSTTGGSAHAVYGYSSVASGVRGLSSLATSFGGNFTNSNASGTGIIGIGNNTAGSYLISGSGGAFTSTNIGVFGYSTGGGGIGMYALASDASAGTGLMAVGNNAAAQILLSGSGGAFTGDDVGEFSIATNSAGTGTFGVGNNLSSIQVAASGSGGAFNSNTLGLYSYCSSNSNGNAGGYFQSGSGSTNYAYVAYKTSGTNYAILGSGTKSTIVKNLDGTPVIMACPEAPEILFEDYGSGQLADGHASVTLDPIFAMNVEISNNHPLRVFIQLEGDCNGVYVTNKSTTGFEVIELNSGTSNTPFTWHVVANRADTKNDAGEIISVNADNRWQPAPGEFPSTIKTLVGGQDIQNKLQLKLDNIPDAGQPEN